MGPVHEPLDPGPNACPADSSLGTSELALIGIDLDVQAITDLLATIALTDDEMGARLAAVVDVDESPRRCAGAVSAHVRRSGEPTRAQETRHPPRPARPALLPLYRVTR